MSDAPGLDPWSVKTAKDKIMIRHQNAFRKHRTEKSPGITEIPSLWRQAVLTESLAPDSLRGGLARARTRLLDSIPSWMLPQFLDQLQEAAI